jgi:hypothetical protein
MKRDKKELEVDFIGGQGSLTKVEEQAISKYLKSKSTKKKIKKNTAGVVKSKTVH